MRGWKGTRGIQVVLIVKGANQVIASAVPGLSKQLVKAKNICTVSVQGPKMAIYI